MKFIKGGFFMWNMKAVIVDIDECNTIDVTCEFYEFGDFIDFCWHLKDAYLFKAIQLTRFPLEVKHELQKIS